MRIRNWLLLVVLLLAVWVAADLGFGHSSSLRRFDGHAVGRLETAMWRSYYGHNSLKLFGELVETLRRQYHMPFWRSCLGAYHAARAAIVFQRGHNRAEYEQALPDLKDFYAMIRRGSDVPFDSDKAAVLELEWWIIHRERVQHAPGDLERSLAALQAEIYQCPESRFTEHAKARAEAMLIRDGRAEAGGVSEQDWQQIGALLDSSWDSLQRAVAE
ncbi:MAG: hypothetical protein C5B51_10910 [Terriglobia bacterium]|nr:MAG: hypothetical protein C5B51_10910 [Terriglobia bacterium]